MDQRHEASSTLDEHEPSASTAITTADVSRVVISDLLG